MSSGPRKVDGFDGATQDHVVKIIMYCSSTTNIAVGGAVEVNADTTYGLGNTVVVAANSGANASMIVGVCDKLPQKADGTVLASGDIIVQVSGIRTDIVCENTVAAGDRLTTSSTTGRAFDLRDLDVGAGVTAYNDAAAITERKLLKHQGTGFAIALSAASTLKCTARLLDPMNLAH